MKTARTLGTAPHFAFLCLAPSSACLCFRHCPLPSVCPHSPPGKIFYQHFEGLTCTKFGTHCEGLANTLFAKNNKNKINLITAVVNLAFEYICAITFLATSSLDELLVTRLLKSQPTPSCLFRPFIYMYHFKLTPGRSEDHFGL